jgi:hypothetical protein
VHCFSSNSACQTLKSESPRRYVTWYKRKGRGTVASFSKSTHNEAFTCCPVAAHDEVHHNEMSPGRLKNAYKKILPIPYNLAVSFHSLSPSRPFLDRPRASSDSSTMSSPQVPPNRGLRNIWNLSMPHPHHLNHLRHLHRLHHLHQPHHPHHPQPH